LTQHPLFQTFALPLLLALLGMAALRAWPGERWTLFGALLGLLGAMAWMPGLDWPAVSRTSKLPWVVLAGLGLGLVLTVLATAREASAARPMWTLLVAVAAWAGAGLWLADGQAGAPLLVGAGLLGGAVLWLLAGGRGPAAAPAGAAVHRGGGGSLVGMVGTVGTVSTVSTVVMAVAALGLTALAATGGSLLLAQLAGMLATTAVAAAGWTWLRPSARRAATTGEPAAHWLWPLGLAWLSIAWTWVLAAPAAITGSTRALQVAVLALAFLVPSLLSRLPKAARAPRWHPFVVPAAAVLAALAAALAMALTWWVGMGGTPMLDTANDPTDPNDPYLTP
jgi:hypothetical protein